MLFRYLTIAKHVTFCSTISTSSSASFFNDKPSQVGLLKNFEEWLFTYFWHLCSKMISNLVYFEAHEIVLCLNKVLLPRCHSKSSNVMDDHDQLNNIWRHVLFQLIPHFPHSCWARPCRTRWSRRTLAECRVTSEPSSRNWRPESFITFNSSKALRPTSRDLLRIW